MNHSESLQWIASATRSSQLLKNCDAHMSLILRFHCPITEHWGFFKGIKLTLLLLAGFITNGRPQLEFGAVCQCAVSWANHDAQARFLQDLTVVVVGVAHGPAAQVSLCVFVFGTVYVPNITICPLLKCIVLLRVLWTQLIIFRFIRPLNKDLPTNHDRVIFRN